MSKKLLILVVFFAFAATNALQAQVCTPSPIFTSIGLPGIWPDPQTTGIPGGALNQPYSTTLTIITPADTTIDFSQFFPGLPTITVDIVSNAVSSVDGLPTQLTYACDTSNCTWPDSSEGCLKISGTPDTAGIFNVDVNIALTVDLPAFPPVWPGGPFTLPDFPVGYEMEVTGVSVDEDLDPNAFQLAQSVPNPTSGMTTINFTHPIPASLEFSVFDMSGKKVHVSDVQARTGLNAFEFNTEGLKPGVYFYSLSNGEAVLTEKMLIAR